MRRGLLKKLIVVGSAVAVLSANSVLVFAASTSYSEFSGYAGSCRYSGEAFIKKKVDGINDVVGAIVSSNGTADLAVRGYGTPDQGITKIWYSNSYAQTTEVSASAKTSLTIGQNIGTAYVSYDDGSSQKSYTLNRN